MSAVRAAEFSKRLDDRPEFVAEALLTSANITTRQVPDLDERALARLYQWLQERLPQDADPATRLPIRAHTAIASAAVAEVDEGDAFGSW